MMELAIVGVIAIGLGALATFLLATRIPEQLLVGGQEHGRYGYLGERNDTVDAPSADNMQGQPLRFAFRRSRSRYRANPPWEIRRRRAERAPNKRLPAGELCSAHETCEP